MNAKDIRKALCALPRQPNKKDSNAGLLRSEPCTARYPHPWNRGRKRPDAAALEEEHGKDNAILAALSRKGEQVIAKNGGHHIQLDEPRT